MAMLLLRENATVTICHSRTILDMNGAEKLLGRGDMFYYPTGAKGPLRVQGCFVSDQEITNVVDYIGKNSEPDYDESINEIMPWWSGAAVLWAARWRCCC